MWQIGRVYAFTPSGDADELIMKIVASALMQEAVGWYETTYDRPFEQDAVKAFKAVVVRGGHDADIHHKRGSTYYVFDTEYDPTRTMYGYNVRLLR